MPKKYDRAYFDRWYRGRNRVSSAEEVRRKVQLAVAACEFFVRRPLRSVLDVACGEAPWRAHLLALRRRTTYLGVDPSDYAVSRFGATRNIRKASFGDLAALRLRRQFDLVVCSDALHYVEEAEIRRGLPELVRLARGVVYIEVLTSDDEIVGDLHGFIHRPATWYRKLFRSAGLAPIGPYLWLAPELRDDAAALELC